MVATSEKIAAIGGLDKIEALVAARQGVVVIALAGVSTGARCFRFSSS